MLTRASRPEDRCAGQRVPLCLHTCGTFRTLDTHLVMIRRLGSYPDTLKDLTQLTCFCSTCLRRTLCSGFALFLALNSLDRLFFFLFPISMTHPTQPPLPPSLPGRVFMCATSVGFSVLIPELGSEHDAVHHS